MPDDVLSLLKSDVVENRIGAGHAPCPPLRSARAGQHRPVRFVAVDPVGAQRVVVKSLPGRLEEEAKAVELIPQH